LNLNNMPREPVVGILKLPICNLRSVHNAVYENGFDPLVIEREADLDAATHLIVPGVGNFAAVMRALEDDGWPPLIRGFAASGRPILGICAGMQLLGEIGTEGGNTPGLSLVHGTVGRLAPEGDLVLPHVGWSAVEFRFPHPVTDGVKPGRDFYFVHSYALSSDHPEEALGESDYGGRFVSIVCRGNVVGFQFHPEKSQANGLKLIENFCLWDGQC